MYQIINIDQKSEWIDIVQKSIDYDFYHTWDYHYLEKSGEPILFYFEMGSDFIAFPFVKRAIPNSDLYDLTSVYGYTGPISNLAFYNISSQMKLNFKTDFLDFLKKGKYVSVFSRLNPILFQEPLMDIFEGIYDNGKIVVVDVKESIENQRLGYQKGLLKTINRLKDLEFCVKESKSLSSIKEFMRIYKENMTFVSATDCYLFSEEYIKSILYSTEFEGKLLLVYHQNIAVCAAIIVCSNKIMQSHLLSTKTAYRKSSPARLLTDEIITLGRKLGMHYFNLGGGFGFKEDSLFDFKKSFSNLTLEYKSWRYIADPEKYNALLKKNNIDKNSTIDFFPLYRSTPVKKENSIALGQESLITA